mgnify:FL=1
MTRWHFFFQIIQFQNSILKKCQFLSIGIISDLTLFRKNY